MLYLHASINLIALVIKFEIVAKASISKNCLVGESSTHHRIFHAYNIQPKSPQKPDVNNPIFCQIQ